MKIIINQPRASYFVGGAEMISFDHAINFLKLNNEVFFFTISPKSIGLKYSDQFKKFCKNYSDRIHIIEIAQAEKIKYIYDIQPGEDRSRWNIESIFYNQKLYEYIFNQRESYDVIFSYYNLDAVFIPKNLINKNILYLCGIPREQNDFQGSFLSVYDDVLAISDEVKESWKKYNKKDIKVISTGVDCDRFLLKNNENINSEEIVLLYVGRLISRKNVESIIYAFERLRNKYKMKLFIVGDGPNKKHLESISDACIFTGVVNDPENYYKQADIFVSPSQFGEGLQGTILEAMSCGLTIVATDTKINKQLLSNSRGFLVEPSVESIVNGIEKAIDTDRVEMAKKNRKYVLDNYSWLNKTREILEVLK